MIAVSWTPSPNIESRRNGRAPDMLILHYTGMASAERACAWLCNRASKVSCHYLVDDEGRIVQMVDESMRAWHAGVSSWKGDNDVNSRSIGIEIHNPGHPLGYPEFPLRQMDAVTELAYDIVTRNRIAPELVLAHSDVAPGRKIDPGEKFDWHRLHAAGIGHWVRPASIDGGVFLQRGDRGDSVAAMQRMLSGYGYALDPMGAFDEPTEKVVTAFQRHFRQQRVDGIADRSTIDTLRRLIEALPQPVAS